MERDFDRQLERLGKNLRDAGVPPEQDLWPAIDQAIDQREGRRRQRTDNWWRRSGWQTAAAIAVIGLVATAILIGQNRFPSAGQPPQAVTTDRTAAVAENSTSVAAGESELAVIDRAVLELEAALAGDPGNLSLARLTIMVQKARGRALQGAIQQHLGSV